MTPHRRTRDELMGADGPRPMTPAERQIAEAAEDLASHVLDHIDTMYPGMWTGVAKNARRSLRNTIIMRVTSLLEHWPAPDAAKLRAAASEAWRVSFALNHLGDLLHQVAEETPVPCAYCGVILPPTPRGERPPRAEDEAGWAREAAQHRPGCAWVESRALPGWPRRPEDAP